MLCGGPRRRPGFQKSSSPTVGGGLGHEISSHSIHFSSLLFLLCTRRARGAFLGRGSSSPGTTFRSEAPSPQSSAPNDPSTPEEVSIPGPLRSFLRMAAISQKITPEEVLPLLARNVVMSGYQGGKPTEFLVLVNWYMDQARELEALAGKGQVIHVSNCDDAKQLLVILGYRLQQSCGPDAALETADANRAFLTIDSGFPLADLEEALREGKPFETALCFHKSSRALQVVGLGAEQEECQPRSRGLDLARSRPGPPVLGDVPHGYRNGSVLVAISGPEEIDFGRSGTGFLRQPDQCSVRKSPRSGWTGVGKRLEGSGGSQSAVSSRFCFPASDQG